MAGSVRAGLADTREEYYDLFNVYWPIGVGVFVVIAVLTVWFVLRFRSDSREFPDGKDETRIEETVYPAVIAIVVAGLLVLTYNVMGDIPFEAESEGRPAAEVAGAERVRVTAAKWRWRFDYPEYGVSEVGAKGRPPTLVVPADTPVRFEQTSIDVVHSFWINERRFKVDAFPGRTTTFTLQFPDEGFLREGGQCNQYCGLLHAEMKFHVDVRSAEEFRRWTRQRQGEGG